METSLKTGFAQISRVAQKSELLKIWGGAAAPAPRPLRLCVNKFATDLLF